MPKTKTAPRNRIAELEDELKRRNARIRELRADLDKADTLASEMRNAHIESWIEGFEMTLNANNEWERNRSFIERDEWFKKYQELVRKWNRSFIERDEWFEKYQALVRPRNVGRPLAASEVQVAEVLRLHKAGGSLRGIADDTSLGLATVRTIVGQKNGTGRTTVKHLERRPRG